MQMLSHHHTVHKLVQEICELLQAAARLEAHNLHEVDLTPTLCKWRKANVQPECI